MYADQKAEGNRQKAVGRKQKAEGKEKSYRTEKIIRRLRRLHGLRKTSKQQTVNSRQ
jgi:hypothetical protein